MYWYCGLSAIGLVHIGFICQQNHFITWHITQEATNASELSTSWEECHMFNSTTNV